MVTWHERVVVISIFNFRSSVTFGENWVIEHGKGIKIWFANKNKRLSCADEHTKKYRGKTLLFLYQHLIPPPPPPNNPSPLSQFTPTIAQLLLIPTPAIIKLFTTNNCHLNNSMERVVDRNEIESDIYGSNPSHLRIGTPLMEPWVTPTQGVWWWKCSVDWPLCQ